MKSTFEKMGGMRRNNRIVSPFQCRIFRNAKVECMENWLSIRTKNSR